MYTTIIDAVDLQGHLGDGDWVVVDCRFSLADGDAGRRAYEAGHIAGAVYAHLDEDLCGPPLTDWGRHPLPSAAAMTRVFGRLGIGGGTQVVVYDDAGGAIAARLWWMLQYMGHEAAALLNGGWQAWLEAGYAVRSGVETARPRLFSGSPREGWLVLLEDVPQAALLVDSREGARYRGEVEPIDAVAGHIAGAVNYYFGRNLDGAGRFLPAEQIRRQLAEVHGKTAAGEVVYYCGSGVTACLNVVGQVYAGMGMGKLYVGSWSEWARVKGTTG